jgi:hypothetical protein
MAPLRARVYCEAKPLRAASKKLQKWIGVLSQACSLLPGSLLRGTSINAYRRRAGQGIPVTQIAAAQRPAEAGAALTNYVSIHAPGKPGDPKPVALVHF